VQTLVNCSKFHDIAIRNSSFYVFKAIHVLLEWCNTHTHTPFVWDYPGEPVPEGKTNLDLNEARDSEWQWNQLGCMSAPRSRQITMPAPHHSVFYRLDALPATQPTVSKH